MFEPDLFYDLDVEGTHFTMLRWFGRVYRVAGGPYNNFWYLAYADAFDEWERRINEAEDAYKDE